MSGLKLQSVSKAMGVVAAALAMTLAFAPVTYAAGTHHRSAANAPTHGAYSSYPSYPSFRAGTVPGPGIYRPNNSSVCINGYRYMERPTFPNDDDPEAAMVPLVCH